MSNLLPALFLTFKRVAQDLFKMNCFKVKIIKQGNFYPALKK